MAHEGQIPNQIHQDAFKEKSGVISNAFKEGGLTSAIKDSGVSDPYILEIFLDWER